MLIIESDDPIWLRSQTTKKKVQDIEKHLRLLAVDTFFQRWLKKGMPLFFLIEMIQREYKVITSLDQESCMDTAELVDLTTLVYLNFKVNNPIRFKFRRYP